MRLFLFLLFFPWSQAYVNEFTKTEKYSNIVSVLEERIQKSVFYFKYFKVIIMEFENIFSTLHIAYFLYSKN